MRVNGVAADGLLLSEEIQVGGPVLVLWLLEKRIDSGQGGRVVMAGVLPDGNTILGRLLHGHICRDSCSSRGGRIGGRRGVLPVTTDEEARKRDQHKASTAPRRYTMFPHSPSLLTKRSKQSGVFGAVLLETLG